MLIAHPPCTFISNAGARWLYPGGELNYERYLKGLAGKQFFMQLYNAPIERICIENPMPSNVFNLPKPTQIIQPYQFGEPWSKKTYLWLKKLKPLKSTKIVTDYRPYVTSGSYSKSHDPRYSGASRAGGASKMRSKTFPGVADAMGEQWGADQG